MTEQEVRKAMKLRGWSFLHRRRRARSYVYAARKIQGKRLERYISSFTDLAQLTIDQLVAKIIMQPIVEPSSSDAAPPVATGEAANPIPTMVC